MDVDDVICGINMHLLRELFRRMNHPLHLIGLSFPGGGCDVIGQYIPGRSGSG